MKRVRLRERPQAVAIDQALRNPNLLGAALGETQTWETWLTVLRAASGLPLDKTQAETFAAVFGSRLAPTRRVRELWCVVGRGGGKSRMAAAVSTHEAMFDQHRLAPGEVGHVVVLSPTRSQADIVFQYCLGFIEASPVLRAEIVSTTAHEIRLRNNVIIGTHVNSFRSIRGRTLLCVVFDESAFWRDETSANPDVEVLRAVSPALLRSNGQLIAISTPYRKVGLLFQRHKDFFAQDDPDVLVVQADSRTFNPTLSDAAITKASADDPEAAIAEWAGLFRTDIAAFLSDADIDACVDRDRPIELPPRPSITYCAFADPSGGRHDCYALCIGHRDGDRTIIDVLRGRVPPFDPKATTEEYAKLLKEYRVREVIGDNYAAAWVETAFADAGIKYVRSELPKGRLYIEGLPAFTRRTVSLPDHPRLLRELRLLERRTHIGGKDSVDHGRYGSDDHANAVFGVLQVAQKPKQGIRIGSYACGGGRITWNDLEPERCRVRWVRIPEKLAPAARGP